MKAKKFSFSLVPALVGFSIAGLVACGFSYLTGLSFWAAFAIVVVAMLVNGFIAEIEDNEPGGFNNPLPPADSNTSPENRKNPERNDSNR